MATAERDTDAKRFIAETDGGNIYIHRGNGIGSAIVFQAVIDGKTVGSLAPNTYLLAKVPTGSHSISVTSNENSEQMTIKVEPKGNYFLKVTPAMGFGSARVHLSSVSEEQGKKDVAHSKLALGNGGDASTKL